MRTLDDHVPWVMRKVWEKAGLNKGQVECNAHFLYMYWVIWPSWIDWACLILKNRDSTVSKVNKSGNYSVLIPSPRYFSINWQINKVSYVYENIRSTKTVKKYSKQFKSTQDYSRSTQKKSKVFKWLKNIKMYPTISNWILLPLKLLESTMKK